MYPPPHDKGLRRVLKPYNRQSIVCETQFQGTTFSTKRRHEHTRKDLHIHVFKLCVGTPNFLHENDFGHFTLDTFTEPPCWKKHSARLSDYGACKSIPLALHRRSEEDSPLLLPFDNHIGTSIWICQPTWDVNQQFAVRIAKPLPGGDHLMYSHHETAYFALHSKSPEKICLASRTRFSP